MHLIIEDVGRKRGDRKYTEYKSDSSTKLTNVKSDVAQHIVERLTNEDVSQPSLSSFKSKQSPMLYYIVREKVFGGF
jgi:hypothetical protein